MPLWARLWVGEGLVCLCGVSAFAPLRRWRLCPYAALALVLLLLDLAAVSFGPLEELASLVVLAGSLLLASLVLSLLEGLAAACSDALARALAP